MRRGEEKSIATVTNGSKTKQGKDERGEPTLMVVSSEEVISVWPSWLNWQQKTVLVCPSKVASTFPVGSSSTCRVETNTSAMLASIKQEKNYYFNQYNCMFSLIQINQTGEIPLLSQGVE